MFSPIRVAALAGGLAFMTLPSAAAAAPVDSTLLIGAAASGSLSALTSPVQNSEIVATGVSSDGRYVAFTSDADGLSTENDDNFAAVYVKDRVTGAVELVSRSTGLTGAANVSGCRDASISSDGQKVAFECFGPLSPTDTNNSTDVYVRNRATGTTTLVSTGPGGIGNSNSNEPSISGGGGYVSFTSYASNFVAGGPSNGLHVYRRLLGGANTVDLVDRATAGQPTGIAFHSSISADGNRVAFQSQATNLVSGATDTNGYADIFWRDMSAGTTGLVSTVNGTNTVAGNGSAGDPSISANGLYVAYGTNSSNAAPGDTDGTDDIHRRTLATSAVTLASRANGAGGVKSNAYTYSPALSADGDAVLFTSNATTLAPGTGNVTQLYLRRIGAGITELVTRASGNGPVSTTGVQGHAVSGDGTVAAFTSKALSADADPFTNAVFARNISAPERQTTLVSRPAGADPFVNLGGNADLGGPGTVSADGRYTVFTSSAAGLPGAPASGNQQAWRRDAETGDVVLVSRAPGASGAVSDASVFDARVSADGNRVVFSSGAQNFGLGGAAAGTNVYVRDIAAGTTVLAGRANGAAGAVPLYAGSPAISADGNRVAFTSNDAVLGVVGSHDHAFVRDLASSETFAITSQTDWDADNPRLDADGSRIVFELEGQLPNEGKGMSTTTHAWWADVASGASTRIDAGQADDQSSGLPTISDDGNRVSFNSDAALVPGDTGTNTDVYVRDLVSGAFSLVSIGTDAKPGSSGSYENQISGDGTKVVFATDSTNIVASPLASLDHAFVRDLAAGTTTLASRADGAAGAMLDQDVSDVAISANGGCVAFDTTATTLAPGLSKANRRVWLRTLASCALPAKPGPTPEPTKTPAITVTPTPKPTAPKLTGVKLSRTVFATKGKRAGTVISFVIDRAARVDAVIARPAKGHLDGNVCKTGAPKAAKGKTKKKAVKACTFLTTVTTLTAPAKAGTGSIAFTGKVKKRALAKGAYVATLTATDDSLTSSPVAVKLTIR